MPRPARALGWTLDYVGERTAFGKSIGTFQNTKFVLAEVATEIDVTQAYVDQCILQLNAEAAHAGDGGAGQVLVHRPAESGRRPMPAAVRRLRLHDRVPDCPGLRRRPSHAIYGGTNEVMKTIIAKSIGL